MNELPDLAPKIQVGLFNVLEERDIQIRGYPVQLELDLCMVFSANPEDYTNRGRIVTPLKDRIGSVVRTHYPLTRELGMAINDQNAWLDRDGGRLEVPIYIKEIVEEMARLARTSSHVNQASGVSVRMSIANLENVISNAERRSLLTGERWIVPPRLRPGARAFLLPRQARTLDVRGRGAGGQADRAARLRGGQEHLHLAPRRPRVPPGRRLFRVRQVGRDRRTSSPRRTSSRGSEKLPLLRKRADEFARQVHGPSLADDARDATTAAAAEFILEGLHVNNKLNKNVKAGNTSYKR